MSDSTQSTPRAPAPRPSSGPPPAAPEAPPGPTPGLPGEEPPPVSRSSARPATSELPELPEDCGIRETLLWRFERPEDDAALRRLGGMLGDLVDETGQFGPLSRRHCGEPETDDPDRAGRRAATSSGVGAPRSIPRETLRAVALDLFYSARSLSELAAGRFASELSPGDALLAEAAEAWSARTTLLAAGIVEALEAPAS